MQSIEMFYGPLDGLVLDEEASTGNELEFGYTKVSNRFKLAHVPSVTPSTFFETYRRTNGTSNDGNIMFAYDLESSKPPTE